MSCHEGGPLHSGCSQGGCQTLRGQQPGFSEHPNLIDADASDEESGFYIDEYELDKDHWAEGFVTLTGDRDSGGL